MIQANELRIGNIVSDRHSSGYFAEVKELRKNRCYYGLYHCTYNDLLSMPLTEEWLIRIGFIKSYNEFGNTFHIMDENGFTAMFTVEHWTNVNEGSKFKNHWHIRGLLNGNKINYIHQLQNLFFALTNQELTINQ